MLILKLAVRNIMGAGIRTWLNVVVLSFTYVAIIFNQGFYYGLFNRVSDAKIRAELGGGQYWHRCYDPRDPLTFQNAHGELPKSIQEQIDGGKAVPVLVLQATFYPRGRMRPVLVKGIPFGQTLLSMPTEFLRETGGALPALIGTRLAESAGLKRGDVITVQWLDGGGAYDARSVEIVQIMKTAVPTIDHGHIWVPLKRFRRLVRMENEATLVVMAPRSQAVESGQEWIFRDLSSLLKDLHDVEKNRTVASWFLYGLLMMLAMVAIFDTQILSIFKRQKEIGTLISMGMTRASVVRLFTVEGVLHGVLAIFIGALWGGPLLNYFSRAGFAVPEAVDGTGYAVGERLYPIYSSFLVAETILLVLMVTVVVSYVPARKIAALRPSDALRRKIN